ncbi:MAG: hypothetical protein Q4A55_04730 [Aerococcus sp.]|nr:hypothetical protein [Aerococcus sp.]
MKKRQLLLMGVSVLFLAACSANDQSMTHQMKDMTQQINYIQVNEASLQKDFEADLKDTEDLSNMTDQKSRVQKNLKKRQDAHAKAKEDLSQLHDETEQKKTKDSTFHSTSRDTLKTIEGYLTEYEQVLKQETAYYQLIAGDKASTADFEDQMAEINQTHQKAQDQLKKVEGKLQNLSEAIMKEEGKDA